MATIKLYEIYANTEIPSEDNECILSIFSEIHSGDFSVQYIAQKTADIAAILGQASHELSLKRRVFIRSVINSEYTDLCSSSQPVTEFLVGDNLPQVVKELNLTNKLGSRPINKHSYSRNRSYAGNKGYYKQNSFLGRGRSNSDHEPWKQGQKYQKQ